MCQHVAILLFRFGVPQLLRLLPGASATRSTEVALYSLEGWFLRLEERSKPSPGACPVRSSVDLFLSLGLDYYRECPSSDSSLRNGIAMSGHGTIVSIYQSEISPPNYISFHTPLKVLSRRGGTARCTGVYGTHREQFWIRIFCGVSTRLPHPSLVSAESAVD